MSRSQLLPGKTTTPIADRHRQPSPAPAPATRPTTRAPIGSIAKTSMSGFDRSSPARRSTIARAAASSAASTVSSTRRPIRTSWTPSIPRWPRLPSTARPGGIEDARLGRDVDREPEARHGAITSSCEIALEARAGDPFVGLDVARPGALDDVVGQRRPGSRLVPRLGLQPVAHELLVEARLRPAGLVGRSIPEARRIGRQRLVDEDQLSPRIGRFVVAERVRRRSRPGPRPRRARTRTSYRRAGCRAAAADRPPRTRRARARAPGSRRTAGPATRSCAEQPAGDVLDHPSKVMFSSCSPSSAFVAGVKIGSGSRSLSRRPAGSGMPQTVPLARYSFQPDPAR